MITVFVVTSLLVFAQSISSFQQHNHRQSVTFSPPSIVRNCWHRRTTTNGGITKKDGSWGDSHFSSATSASTGTWGAHLRTKETMRWMVKDNNSDDDDFDPLLSPHAYPKGTSSPSNQKRTTDNDDDWSPFKMRSVKDDFKGATDDQYGVEKSVFTRKWSTTINSVEGVRDENPNQNDGTSSSTSSAEGGDENNSNNDVVDDPSTFDPLISPHYYPKGTSAGPVKSSGKKTKTRIGVLLIDHGSRREASNAHLEKLAELYQQRAPSHYVIKAAHMEIAEPSIKDGIQSLIEEEGVGKIICHPYFLSPGRHVVEDIPQLIEEAMDELRDGLGKDIGGGGNGGVEVLTTSHVGSSMALMVDLISTMVDETVGVEPDSGFVQKDPSQLGGFFGEIQRMLDEQL